MAMMIYVKHECDRCHAISDVWVTDVAAFKSPPPGWHMFTITGLPRLWCADCVAGLQRFQEDNERVEQSR